ncbi:unnamed protein product [Paramecium primaurelia]|uniref:Uncharacterized protein n=1 Tax=Paramecium primaurelia TaxID=5886 RepID=A0A8S1NR95_PARPR|nr:unnamed protein product [Paramecium primaurelia]
MEHLSMQKMEKLQELIEYLIKQKNFQYQLILIRLSIQFWMENSIRNIKELENGEYYGKIKYLMQGEIMMKMEGKKADGLNYLFENFWENGQVKFSGEYKNNKRNGRWNFSFQDKTIQFYHYLCHIKVVEEFMMKMEKRQDCGLNWIIVSVAQVRLLIMEYMTVELNKDNGLQNLKVKKLEVDFMTRKKKKQENGQIQARIFNKNLKLFIVENIMKAEDVNNGISCLEKNSRQYFKKCKLIQMLHLQKQFIVNQSMLQINRFDFTYKLFLFEVIHQLYKSIRTIYVLQI